jgi:4'-phosphopantetheinyl transferase EntD
VGAEQIGAHDVSALYPEEHAAVSGAVPKRVAEFAAGRHCAREALRQLGISPGALPVLPSRAPAWPVGVVGSISHCNGYCGAVVARARDVTTIGFDVEIRRSVPREIWPDIASAEELGALAAQQRLAMDDAITLLFSAKESYFKAEHPIYDQMLDFGDVACTLLDEARFRIRPLTTLAPVPPAAVGHFWFDAERVYTGIAW